MSNSISRAAHSSKTARLMKPFGIADDTVTRPSNQPRRLLVQAQPIITSKGRAKLALHSDAYLDYGQVTRLRDWLSAWLAHHREDNQS